MCIRDSLKIWRWKNQSVLCACIVKRLEVVLCANETECIVCLCPYKVACGLFVMCSKMKQPTGMKSTCDRSERRPLRWAFCAIPRRTTMTPQNQLLTTKTNCASSVTSWLVCPLECFSSHTLQQNKLRVIFSVLVSFSSSVSLPRLVTETSFVSCEVSWSVFCFVLFFV